MPWPLFDFAFVSDTNGRLETLAKMSEPENWGKPESFDHVHPVLHNYLQYTFMRVQDEGKIVITNARDKACFNTGLVTPNQESIYAYFVPHHSPSASGPEWYLKAFLKESDLTLTDFDKLPEMANYFEEPKDLIYDTRCQLRINYDHIVDENRNRFPEPFRSMKDTYQLRIAFQGAVDHAIKRAKRNYKTAIPQFYENRLQLLLPICMSNPAAADLALAVERHQDIYRAATCLTLEMAYSNARLLARPNTEWLHF